MIRYITRVDCCAWVDKGPNIFNRKGHPSTVRSSRATLKAGRLGGRTSPQSQVSRAKILSPRGPILGGSRDQPYEAVRLRGEPLGRTVCAGTFPNQLLQRHKA